MIGPILDVRKLIYYPYIIFSLSRYKKNCFITYKHICHNLHVTSPSAHSDDKENDVALRLWSFLYRSILHGSADDVCEVGGTTQPCNVDCMFVGIQQALVRKEEGGDGNQLN